MLAGAYPVPHEFDGVIGLGLCTKDSDDCILEKLIKIGLIKNPIVGLIYNR